jgi:hypothetical protein
MSEVLFIYVTCWAGFYKRVTTDKDKENNSEYEREIDVRVSTVV